MSSVLASGVSYASRGGHGRRSRIVGLAQLIGSGAIGGATLHRTGAALVTLPFGELPALVEGRDTLLGKAVVVDPAELVAAHAVVGRDVVARDAQTRERVAGEAIGVEFLGHTGYAGALVVVMFNMAELVRHDRVDHRSLVGLAVLIGLAAQKDLHEGRVVEDTSGARDVRRIGAHRFVDRSVGTPLAVDVGDDGLVRLDRPPRHLTADHSRSVGSRLKLLRQRVRRLAPGLWRSRFALGGLGVRWPALAHLMRYDRPVVVLRERRPRAKRCPSQHQRGDREGRKGAART